jgi:hypothetical protein
MVEYVCETSVRDKRTSQTWLTFEEDSGFEYRLSVPR